MSVYFIAAPDAEMVKIGYSEKPWTRLSGLRSCAPFPLELVAVIDGGPGEEEALHDRFSEFWSHGEWFRLDGLLAEFISAQDPSFIGGGLIAAALGSATPRAGDARFSEKACLGCGAIFTPYRRIQSYCTAQCQKEAGNRRLKDGCAVADYLKAWGETHGAPAGSDDAEIHGFAAREMLRLAERLNGRDSRAGRPPAKLRVAQMMEDDASVIDRVAA